MGVITLGLEKIEFSDIAVDGGVGTDWTVLGKTERDSLQVTTDDPDIVELFSEESDIAEEVIESPGSTTITFNLMNPDTATFEKVFGGDVVGDIWEAPAQNIKLNQSIRITPRKGLIYTFPATSVVAKLNASFGRQNASGLSITATVLTPTKSGESYLYVSLKP